MIPLPCGGPEILPGYSPALVALAQGSAGLALGVASESLEASESFAPAEMVAGPGEHPLVITADRIEADLDDALIRARGNVAVDYGSYHLQSGDLWYDSRNDRGRASGAVRLRVKGYFLDSDQVEFDIANQQALTGPWKGVVAGRGRFAGDFLFLSPSYAYSAHSTFSPCMAEDPGYFLSSDKFEWFPYAGKQHFGGSNVTIHLSGAAVARVPSFESSIDPSSENSDRSRAGRAVNTQLGYNTFDGAFANGTGTFKLTEGHTATIPVRITQGRGFFIGTTQTYGWDRWKLNGDATYQTRYTGGTSGPRANIGAVTTLPKGPQVALGFGFRSDVGGQALHRLPELALNFPTVPIGPLAFTTWARAGYLIENDIDLSKPQPDPLNPFGVVPERARAQAGMLGFRANLTPPAWRPNFFWESQPYFGGSVGTYVERDDAGTWSAKPAHQAVGTAGLRNIQHWNSLLSTQMAFEANRTDGLSPFFHDRTYPGDLITAGITVSPTTRWSVSLGTLYSKAPDQLAFGRSDLQVRLGYRAPCLSWSLALQILSLDPFSPALSFDYQIGSP